MNFLTISNMILPMMVVVVIIYGLLKEIPIYDVFIEGAKEGLELSVTIIPYLLGMVVAINIFVSSDFLSIISNLLGDIFYNIGFPIEIFPMALVRPISGTASLAILNDILTNYHPDSFVGRVASTLQGSTDTTLYVLTLYFGSIGIKKGRYALTVGLIADFFGIIASVLVCSLIFG